MKLSVCILTYNHSKYIQQCIDSVLEQQVNFDYEIIIADDFSTDNTRAILTSYQNLYPDRIRLLLNTENIGIAENYKSIFNNAQGEYIAICEGDDYWCDMTKLQKQCDFLDNHQDYSFVGAYNNLLTQTREVIYDKYDYLPKPDIIQDWELYGEIFNIAKLGPVTRTVTICFRKQIIEPYLHISGVGNDMVLQTILSYYGKFAKIKSVMGVYRLGSGISTDPNNLQKKLYYNEWYVGNRLLQKKIFPAQCDWDEEELQDRGTYIRLKDAIRRFSYKEIKKFRSLILSRKFKKKLYCKYSSCIIFVIFLSLYINIINHE